MRIRLVFALILFCLPLYGQGNSGELRLKVTDPGGLGVKTNVVLVSQSNDFRSTMATDDGGTLIAKRLPYGLYRVLIDQPGFAEVSMPVEVRSAIPAQYAIKLTLAPVNTSIVVQDSYTLIDPHRPDSSNEIGSETIQTRATSLSGRSLQDLVNSEPGWLYEGNAVLHPRGAEYQTQFVVDGIPLTDNRSPGFAPEIEADDVNSMNIYTAGIPAEFGRKMGGVIEVNTLKDTKQGLHGQAVLAGGSFDTGDAFAQVQDQWSGNTLGASASGSMTSRYLNPVVPENYTNNGTTGDFAANYEHDFTPQDRLGAIVRHSLSRFEIPNEQVQQSNGQRQDGDNFETMGIVSYQHVFSSDMLGALRGMVRDGSNDLNSNPESTPVIAFLHNNYREIYFNGSIAVHHGRHEFKAGIESDSMFLHENFSDTITDPTQFDEGTPTTFAFTGNRPDLEQSVYVQDLVRLGNWTISAGLRWDHYQLLVNQNAFSPRVSVARYFPSAGLVLHASYDRIFQTPDSGNILLSSSAQVVSLNPDVFRLPVEPSHGNYFEIGGTKSLFDHLRFDANYYRRYVNNYADDDQLLSTAVSFPIAFDKAVIYGAEAKLEIPKWGRWLGYASYSYMVGNAWLPVTGGLFLGDDADDVLNNLTGHFPDSQDQRNSIRVRMRYQALSRLWFAGSTEYGSGLPFEFSGDQSEALAQYGPNVVSRVNFDRGRVRPSLAVDASIGADLYKGDRFSTTLQADVQNINNRLNVIDFGGLFSGNAIGPPRSWALRLQASF
jgi:outer membrane cobalamin receptor